MHGVGDAGIHPVAREGHPQVRRVAGDEDPPVAEAVGDEATRHPVLLPDHVEGEVRPDPEDVTDRLVGVEDVEVALPGGQGPVHEPQVLAVDGDDIAPHLVVDDPRHPRRPPVAEEALHRGGADEAGAGAPDLGIPDEAGTDRLAHPARPAVAADEVVRAQVQVLTRVQVTTGDGHAPFVLGEGDELGAGHEAHPRQRQQTLAQDRLEPQLRLADHRLRCRPGTVVEAGLRALGSRRHGDAGELGAGQARRVDRVGRVVVSQARRPHPVGDAEAAEGLHRAGGDGVALRVGRVVGGPRLEDDDLRAAHRGVDGQAGPDRAGTGDDDLRVAHRAPPLSSGTAISCSRALASAWRNWPSFVRTVSPTGV
ncbi:hypothetical protein NYE39_09355 [Janibacter sp. FSL W8-0316]|uniref:hypothetical protein n=1 Tax=Janibacter sp. FSL W8-0316 TaxID=2975325 RepID=UPI001F3C4D30|nr:hypothetical protein [Janibacter indicus]